MAVVFGIETSGDSLSLAISRGPEIVRSLDLHLPHSHSNQIWTLSEALLKSAGMEKKDVEILAVGKGPGSYTGIRIGTAFAKGWAFASQTPLVSVGTLENLFSQVQALYPDLPVYVALDARRNEVFRAHFQANGEALKLPSAALLEEEVYLKDHVERPLLLTGSGAEKVCRQFDFPATWIFDSNRMANAETCCRLGWEKSCTGKWEDPSLFEPDYLKPVYITRKQGA